jgi:SAM-dependent methyltransferase
VYGEVFCKVYNELGWNYYPEAFGENLLNWIRERDLKVETALDLACGTGVLCRVLRDGGIQTSGADLSEGMIAVARAENPDIPFAVADMVTYRPKKCVDLITCTGDSLNHIPALEDVQKIFGNVHHSLNSGGFFIFDLLNEREVSTDEPFEFDYSDTIRVWFQMTRPTDWDVNLKIRVFEAGKLQIEENIKERLHDPQTVCDLLRRQGFRVVRLSNRLRDADRPGTTWYIIAEKE